MIEAATLLLLLAAYTVIANLGAWAIYRGRP